ncbi:MAG: DEAD/DEAH box helicase family protein, partial [Aggregatilineales bacterium]
KLLDYVSARDPYDVYIRALVELYRLPEAPVPAELKPLTAYQRPVVARVLQALQDYRGALLVASTGLGKTVMAAHIVAYLRMENRIDRVIVISPAGLKEQWKNHMWMATAPSREFSYNNLSSEIRRGFTVRILDDELSRVTERTLIILDESHHMRNREDADGEKIRYERVRRAVHERGASLLMLTATPFSRNIEDVNAQLGLLPLSEFADMTHRNFARWRVGQIEQMSDLPPCAVLTTPSVVSCYSEVDEHGERYVKFAGNERRYFPRRLKFHTESYHNPLDDLLENLLNSRLLDSTPATPDQMSMWSDDELPGRKVGFFRANVMREFCSSPAQAEATLKKLRDGGYDKMRFARQDDLSRFVSDRLPEVQRCKEREHDPKLDRVLQIIEEAVIARRKVIIFCFYIETALHLAETINKTAFLLNIHAETTANKDPEQADRLIRQFAPLANDAAEDAVEERIDVLIATGALAEGFNLQDASVLINYDLSWTVLTLAQRLGRILRPWHEPREIDIYNFVPSTMRNPNIAMAVNWHHRLQERNRQHQSLADIPVLLDEAATEDELEMQSLARQYRIFEGNTNLDLDQTLNFLKDAQKLTTSTFWTDLADLTQAEIERVTALPFGFRSARVLKGKKRLFVLFQHRRRFYTALFDERGQLLLDSEQRDEIMEIIRCEPEEPLAPMGIYPSDDAFDEWIDAARAVWARARDFAPESVRVVCSMALLPEQCQFGLSSAC